MDTPSPEQVSRYGAIAPVGQHLCFHDSQRAAINTIDRATLSLEPAAGVKFDARPALTVQMLDGFQLWIGADPVVGLPCGKTRSLFKLLLLHRRKALSRAKLCSMLWPDADPAGARNSLNVTLHRLRRALGDPGLVRHNDTGYQVVVAGAVWLDTERFMAHATVGAVEDGAGRLSGAMEHYETALALYRSDILEEGDHEPALAADSQALRDRLNQVLERLATLREDSGDLHGCLRAAHRHLSLDVCNEVAHRRLMRCYARLGQPQLAERQYRNCVSALRAHLGINPHTHTTDLCRQIGRQASV